MAGTDDALSGLYPVLHGAKQDAAELDAALLDSVRQKAQHTREVVEVFVAENAAAVVEVAKAIADVYRGGGRLFTMGNGGSSCDAAHLAVEFLHPITTGRPALTAINLTTDVAMLTAVGNDIGFDHIFLRQIVAQGRAGDGLVGISTSGNSQNLIAAFDKAKEMRLTTIALLGQSGGRTRQSQNVDHCLVVETDSIHRIQECHVAIYHILWDLVHTLLADERGASVDPRLSSHA